MRIHCLQHLKNDTLGNIGTWIARKGHKLTKTMLFEDSHFPDPDEFDLLLIMGGTMSVYQEEEYPWLKPEKKFVRTVLESGNLVFGSCFGGQIIADVLGGKITRNQYKEIGWHTVRSIEGEDQKNVRNLRLPSCMYPEFTGFMWHGDTFEIPIGAMKLFESEACPNQGFVYNGNVLGLQFHPEADRQWIRNLIKTSGHELVPGKYIQSEKDIYSQENYFESSTNLAFSLMDWFEEKCKSEND